MKTIVYPIHSTKDIKKLLKKGETKCHICNQIIEEKVKRKDLHPDHDHWLM